MPDEPFLPGMELRPQVYAALISLVALVPVAVFALDRNDPWVALSAVCVVVIAASVYYMFSPAEEDATAGEDSTPTGG